MCALALGCGDGGSEPTPAPSPTPSPSPTVAPDSSTLDGFIQAFCDAFVPYYARFSERVSAFESSFVPAEHKARQVAMLEDLLALAVPLSQQADRLPLPDVDGGEEIRTLYIAALKLQEEKLDRFLTDARTWDDSSQEALDRDIAETSAMDTAPPLENELNALGERYPAAAASITLIDSRPDDCAIIFIS